MKKVLFVLVMLIAVTFPAVAEYSFTQELEMGSYTVYLPLGFEKWRESENSTGIFGNPAIEAEFLMEIDKYSVDQVFVSCSKDDPLAKYSTSGDVIGLWESMIGERDHSYIQAGECIALICVDDATYGTTAASAIINGKDSLEISVMSKSHDRAIELLDGILGGINAQEFRQP